MTKLGHFYQILHIASLCQIQNVTGQIDCNYLSFNENTESNTMFKNAQLYCELTTGYKMPMVGMGTYLITEKDDIWNVVDEGLAIGYRLIDTAAMYGNEAELGCALKKLLPKHKLTRKDIFLTSKLPPTDHGNGAMDCLTDSLKRLQCDYLDLYLIHWPGSSDCDPKDPINEILREKSWAKLVEAKQAGLVRSLGVSNYCIRHLEALLANCYGEKPAVNQIEWHPHWHEDDIREFCEEQKILLQAYFSFGGTEQKSLLTDPTIKSISQKIGKSPAQVLLQWSLQQRVAVIPKATSKYHLQANMDLTFLIPPEYMTELSSLPQIKYGCDSSVVF